MRSKAVRMPREIGASAPPASIIGTIPLQMSIVAYPMASVLLVQPVERTCEGPRKCRAIDSSLERFPCVPAVIEKSDPLPSR